MNRKDGKLNYRALFAGDPENVVIVQARDYRTLGTDRYSIWDLSAVCDAQGVDIPKPGRYRAMVKELRLTRTEPLVNADQLAALYDERTGGIEADPENRLIVSQYADSRHRPIIHCRTADVRQIGVEWDSIPRIGTGAYWIACNDWKKTNVAVHWGMYEQAPFGCVALAGNALDNESWNMPSHLAFAFALGLEDGGIPYEIVAERYPFEAKR